MRRIELKGIAERQIDINKHAKGIPQAMVGANVRYTVGSTYKEQKSVHTLHRMTKFQLIDDC